MSIKVASNGYGVIGRRIADAVKAQPDMELVGIAKVSPDYKAKLAVEKGYKIFSADEKGLEKFRGNGIEPAGTSKDLIEKADIIIDSTPGNIGPSNKEVYTDFGKKALFQGGEKHDLTGFSFVAQCNYGDAAGKQFTRVVSCNTTGLCRVLNALDQEFGVNRARVVIARRAADPDETTKGPIDAVSLDPVHLPSHHGPDVNTVMPHINISTMAIKIPTTHMHLHSAMIQLKDKTASSDRVIDTLNRTSRIMLVNSKSGIKSTGQVLDLGRELGRPRNDLFESIIWEDSVSIVESEVFFFMGVHQESIVIPENIDAIRAVMQTKSAKDSIHITNQILGIRK